MIFWFRLRWLEIGLYFIGDCNGLGSFFLAFVYTHTRDIGSESRAFLKGVLWSHWKDLKVLWQDKGLCGSALGDAWFWSIGGFFYLVLVKLSGEVVVGKVGMGGMYGYWFLLLGVGIMLGSLVVAYLNRGRIEIGLTPIGAFLLPLALLLLYWVDPLDSLFEWGCLFLGFSGALFVVPLNGYMQDRAGESERGRVLAASNLLTQLSSVGLILVHALLSYLGFFRKTGTFNYWNTSLLGGLSYISISSRGFLSCSVSFFTSDILSNWSVGT